MKTINLNHITKIEGHAKLHVKIEKNRVEKVKLSTFEGSRFFEGILKGKKYNDISHISSRICGICSVVHSVTALKAIENAFKIKVSEQTNLLRELLLIGGTIQSHVLHLYFLVLPDYLGYENAIKMAAKHKNYLKCALKIKQAGNKVVRVMAGRDIHPIAAVPGGFSRIPKQEDLNELLKQLRDAKKDAQETVKLFKSLKCPKFEKKTEYFSLFGEKPFYSDKIIKCVGHRCLPTNDYQTHFKEYLKHGSTSEFVVKSGKSYTVGALARVLDNRYFLSKRSQQYTKFIEKQLFNPFMNNLAQAIEIYEGIVRCIDILECNKFKQEPRPKIKPRKATGIGASEAPRGMLFHTYKFDINGCCTFADITTPTSQNLQTMEEAIKEYIDLMLNKKTPKDKIKHEIQKLIRAYDPCMSCSTHFLELKWEES